MLFSEHIERAKGETEMDMVYVFNYWETEGYAFRAPRFVAYLVCRFGRWPLDYAVTEAGE